MPAKPARVPRLYVAAPLASGETLQLPADAAHHAASVLRQRVGDALVLFDGSGGEYAAGIVAIERSRVSVSVGEKAAVERESPVSVTLAQGISSSERMDFAIQKAVELGVAAIVPLASEKSIVRLSGERAQARVAHWRRIAIAACEQSGRNRLPRIDPPRTVAEFCAARREAKSGERSLRLLLAPAATASLKVAAAALQGEATIAVGPEAGFSEAEEAMLVRAGFAAVSIGPRILRTETAALAALAVLNAMHGDF